MRRKDEMAMSPTKSSGKAAKKAGKAQKSVLNKTGEKVMGFLSYFWKTIGINCVSVFCSF